MRLVVFRSVVVLAVGAAVLVGVLYIASTVDARAPEVIGFELTQSLPDDPETALITTSLEVAFNELVQVEPGPSPVTIVPAVDGTVSWSGSTLIFTPRDPLELETAYEVTVAAAIRDLSGNRIGTPPPTFAFETAGRPAVVATLPDDGAEDVPLEEPILITFSTLMDTGSVEGALSVEPAFAHDVRWSGAVLEIVPEEALEPGREYVVRIDEGAADIAGVPLADAMALAFRTVAAGLEPMAIVPADGVDGIAPSAPIAVIFDRAIDPESVTREMLTIAPEVAGTLEVVTAAGDPVEDGDAAAGTVLRFAPSGSLPLNTTFEVSIAAGVRALDGALLAETLSWTFTTGAPAATLSNQITFVSDRGGVANVWAMNADGSGQHQVSTELSPVLDYAVAPDGSRLVVADGRRLVAIRADGSDRRVLTDDRHLEFDPAYSPNGQRLAFARADAETGDGLGLWLVAAEGGDPIEVELPPEIGVATTPSPSGTGADRGPGLLRAPRFSPDGQALAFVDSEGRLAILELPDERLTRVDAGLAAPAAWLPDSSAVLVTHHPGDRAPLEPIPPGGPATPLAAADAEGLEIGLVNRSGRTLHDTELGAGALVAVDARGRIAYLDEAGRLHLSDGPDGPGSPVPGLDGQAVLGAALAPGEDALAIVVAAPEVAGAAGTGVLEVLDLGTGARTVLAPSGASPRWLP